MDFLGFPTANLRAAAWEKLALLSAKATSKNAPHEKALTDTFKDLLYQIQFDSKPLKNSKLQIIYAVTNSTCKMDNEYQANSLLPILKSYLLSSQELEFSENLSASICELSPWTKLTFELTYGISNLAINVPSTEKMAIEAFKTFLNNLNVKTLKGQLCFIGFVQGLCKRREILSYSLVEMVLSFSTTDFLDNVEDISFSEEINILESFGVWSQEFSSLFFILLFGRVQIQYLKKIINVPDDICIIDHMLKPNVTYVISNNDKEFVNKFIDYQEKYETYLENASDRVISSSLSRTNCSYKIRANAMEIYAFGIATSVDNYETMLLKVNTYFTELTKSIDNRTLVAFSMLDSNLLMNVCGAGALLSETDQAISLMIVRHYPSLIKSLIMDKNSVKRLTTAVIYCLKSLSQEDITSSIYNLTNLLTPSNTDDIESQTDSADLLGTDVVSPNIVTCVLEIAKSANDPSVNTLVCTLLSQKLTKKNLEFNGILLEGLIEFVDFMSKKDFDQLLKNFYDSSLQSLAKDKLPNLKLWKVFSRAMSKRIGTELYTSYLEGMLGRIISKGDMDKLEQHRPDKYVSAAANEIGLFLGPLAEMLPPIDQQQNIPTSKETIRLFQNMWFNLAVHGFAYGSSLYRKYEKELIRIAHNSPPLASESTWNRSETSIEMNTILRRGTSKTTERIHKETLKSILNINFTDNKLSDNQLTRPGLMFLSSTLLVEFSRVRCGDCSTILEYLSDPSVIIAKLQDHISVIAQYCCKRYVEFLMKGGNSVFSGGLLTLQLKRIFIACCHRVSVLQNCAFLCADVILKSVPSGLCYQTSTFALLDILSLLFQSIIDADTNEYEPMTEFKSKVTDIDLSLSDSYEWRQSTLDRFTKHGANWVTNALTVAKYDMKSILKAYVNEADAFHRTINFGVSFALDMASKILAADREFHQLQGIQSRKLNTTAGFLTQSADTGSSRLLKFSEFDFLLDRMNERLDILRNTIEKFPSDIANNNQLFSETMEDLSKVILLLKTDDIKFFKALVELPFLLFNSYAIEHSLSAWLSVMKGRPEHSILLLTLILKGFEKSIHDGNGLYTKVNDLKDPKFDPMEYIPSNKKMVDKKSKNVSTSFKPHLLLIRFLSSHFNATLFQSDHILKMFASTIKYALKNLGSASLHPYARMIRFELILLGTEIYHYYVKLKTSDDDKFLSIILDASLSWFIKPVATPFGNNKLKVKADLELLKLVSSKISKFNVSSLYGNNKKRAILSWFLSDEINIIETWLTPLFPSTQRASNKVDESLISLSYQINGKLALNMVDRCQHNGNFSNSYSKHLKTLILNDPFEVADTAYAIPYIISSGASCIAFWTPAAPVDAIKLFLPPFDKDDLVVQYAMRSIESFDIHLTFFYVPQIVQTMRHDSLGYIRRFILETANVSQLFAHQIIWNMAANSFKDEDSQIPDDIKPALDDIKHTMIKNFSVEDKRYFEKEFKFFDEVTGISGKLKPYIKKSKPEKKAKIDEEMAKIKVEEGVYLPSNPDGTVVDIDRKSGKPLQSHAKAPFLATFMIKKMLEGNEFEVVKTSAIFKVGDDCRQDVLALQLISVFRSIWMNLGVDVYVFPYRVTATAPGCGIIDVLPNSISRDMLGREAVNGLYEYFITQFGPETGIEFQRARNNFVKSLAAYSIITYLLAIKDRHNGNIMYDKDGHILHIDFGFCFDIVPGGVKFEQSPFKLTREMVRVMGGSVNTQAYKWYEELCVKCFLACRLHMDTIVDMVYPMLESGLPCFKPNSIKHLRQRFAPEKSEREAAVYIRGLIKKSFESFATKGYDEFQRITNGIPY